MIEDNELRNLFQVESEERLKSLEELLKNLESNPQDKESIESAFRDAHTIKGSARMLNLHMIESTAHHIENILDIARKGQGNLSSQNIQEIYENLFTIQSLVKEAVTGKPAEKRIFISKPIIENRPIEKKEPGSIPTATPSPTPPSQPLPFSQTPPSPSIPSQPSPLTSQKKNEDESKIEVKKEIELEEKTLKKWERPYSISSVRIDMQQVDNLMNQAASLIVAKNRIIQSFEQVDDLVNNREKKFQQHSFFSYDNASRELFSILPDDISESLKGEMIFLKESEEYLSNLRNEIYEDLHKLELVISSLTDEIYKLSLLSLSKLFDLFPHMVNDLIQTTKKEVEFIIEGGEITVDKKIIENMKDPIMHLLRNVFSHGIESEEEREKKGKPKKGTIRLIGRQTSHSVFIEVEDDGRGLNTEKIKSIAIQRQIIDAEKAQTMSVAELHSLIFLSGFSTSSQVTDLSGRGVGMDVVKNHVEKLNGSLTIHSVENQGCRFSIELPITHITSQVILMKIDKRVYALPVDMIEECLYLSPEQIFSGNKNEVVQIKNRTLDIVFLKDLIGTPVNKDKSEATHYPCIIINMEDKRLALIVDEILGEQKVIVIPPNRILSTIKNVFGTTILKTGEVCIILNPFHLQLN